MTRTQWFFLAILAVSGVSVTPCQAEALCPWMNAATAGGFLGGDVQMAVTEATADGDVTCDFKVDSVNRAASMLTIAVHTMAHRQQEFPGYLAMCAPGSPVLKGIGNEAVRCLSSSGASKGSELIIGRVRERAFVVTIKAAWISRPPTSSTKTRNAISDNSENIAEQVAGALF